jgi:hypothetical protein
MVVLLGNLVQDTRYGADVGGRIGDDGAVTNCEITPCQMRQVVPQSIKPAHTEMELLHFELHWIREDYNYKYRLRRVSNASQDSHRMHAASS